MFSSANATDVSSKWRVARQNWNRERQPRRSATTAAPRAQRDPRTHCDSHRQPRAASASRPQRRAPPPQTRTDAAHNRPSAPAAARSARPRRRPPSRQQSAGPLRSFGTSAERRIAPTGRHSPAQRRGDSAKRPTRVAHDEPRAGAATQRPRGHLRSAGCGAHAEGSIGVTSPSKICWPRSERENRGAAQHPTQSQRGRLEVHHGERVALLGKAVLEQQLRAPHVAIRVHQLLARPHGSSIMRSRPHRIYPWNLCSAANAFCR